VGLPDIVKYLFRISTAAIASSFGCRSVDEVVDAVKGDGGSAHRALLSVDAVRGYNAHCDDSASSFCTVRSKDTLGH